MNAVADRSNATASSLSELLSSPGATRQQMFGRLAMFVTETGDAARQASKAMAASGGAQVDASPCVRAMNERASATRMIASAVEGAIGGATGEVVSPSRASAAAGTLTASEAGLGRSDSAWEVCASRFSRSPGAPRIERSAWVGGDSIWGGGPAPSYVAALQSSASLAPAHALAVLSVRLVPEPVFQPGGGMLLTAKGRLLVTVVVKDTGNVDEPKVQISASFATRTVQVEVSIEAGGSLAVDLPVLRVPQSGSGPLSVKAIAEPSGATASSREQLTLLPG